MTNYEMVVHAREMEENAYRAYAVEVFEILLDATQEMSAHEIACRLSDDPRTRKRLVSSLNNLLGRQNIYHYVNFGEYELNLSTRYNERIFVEMIGGKPIGMTRIEHQKERTYYLERRR